MTSFADITGFRSVTAHQIRAERAPNKGINNTVGLSEVCQASRLLIRKTPLQFGYFRNLHVVRW